jgi:Type II intron maturase
MRDRIQLRIPEKKLSEFCQRKGYGTYETTYPSHKSIWLRMDDEEILLAYNAEMQGIANYYALATGAKKGLSKLLYIAEVSFLKTLAAKYQTTVRKMAAKHRQGRDFVVTTTTKEGKTRRYKLFKLRNWKPLERVMHCYSVDATLAVWNANPPPVMSAMMSGPWWPRT